MRILCLHGYATNGDILERQLEPLRALLPGDWEYEFVEAGMEPSTIIYRKCCTFDMEIHA